MTPRRALLGLHIGALAFGRRHRVAPAVRVIVLGRRKAPALLDPSASRHSHPVSSLGRLGCSFVIM